MLKRGMKPRTARKVLESLQMGNSIVGACQQAGMDVSTFYKWRRHSPVLDKAVKGIVESRVQLVEDALYRAALDGNTTAQIFFLTNRDKDRWKHKDHQIAIDNRKQTVIQVNQVQDGELLDKLKERYGDRAQEIATRLADVFGIRLPEHIAGDTERPDIQALPG